MKQLRQFIRKVLLEKITREDFIEELTGNPKWDEGTRDAFSDDPQKYVNARKRGRLAKKVWAKYVDREYIQSLVYIHWGLPSDIYKLVKAYAEGGTTRDELACSAYEPGKVAERSRIGSIGLLIEGHVSLLGNHMDDVFSGDRKQTIEANPEMGNQSGYNRSIMSAISSTYILDQESFTHRNSPAQNRTEAFVDNWKIKAIVFKPDPDLWRGPMQQSLVKEIEKDFGLNLPVLRPDEL